MTTTTKTTKELGIQQDNVKPKKKVVRVPEFELMGPPREPGTLSVFSPFVVAIVGDAGGGKTLLLTYAAARALAAGGNVWANYDIGPFEYKNGDGGWHKTQAMKLENASFYKLKEDVSNGLVCVSEMQYYVDSRKSMKLQNQIWNYALRQKRKRNLAIWYDCFDITQVDLRVRAETDILIRSRDMHFTFFGIHKARNIDEGQYFKLDIWDLKGKLTGVPDWYDYKEPYKSPPRCSYMYWRGPTGEIYATSDVVDPFEAQTTLNMRELRAGHYSDDDNSKENNEMKLQLAAETIYGLVKAQHKVHSTNVAWPKANIFIKQQGFTELTKTDKEKIKLLLADHEIITDNSRNFIDEDYYYDGDD